MFAKLSSLSGYFVDFAPLSLGLSFAASVLIFSVCLAAGIKRIKFASCFADNKTGVCH